MILCFSGTGNTMHVARAACDLLGDKIVRVGFDDLPSEVKEPLGILFPVHFYSVPLLMLDALKSIDASASPYVYIITTCGGDAGSAANIAEKALGRQADAVYNITMPDNFIVLYDPPKDCTEVLAKADEDIQTALSAIADKKSNRQNASVWYSTLAKVLKPAYRYYACKTKRFYLKGDCIGCGKCVKACLAHAIIMRDGKPVWVKPYCTGCFACINLCPNNIIQRGRSTELRGRYKYPE